MVRYRVAYVTEGRFAGFAVQQRVLCVWCRFDRTLFGEKEDAKRHLRSLVQRHADRRVEYFHQKSILDVQGKFSYSLVGKKDTEANAVENSQTV